MISRRTVLIAWEHGAGMGHIHLLAPIATALAGQGFRLVFVLRSLDGTDALAGAMPQAIFRRAPRWRSAPAPLGTASSLAATYADVLWRCGYDSPDSLRPIVGAWRKILDDVQPSLLLCDHSPGAILAAAGRVPIVNIGTGFSTPPVGQAFFPLFPPALAGAAEREAQVLAAIHDVQTHFGGPSPKTVSGLLGFAENFTCCLPELDPYRSVRPEPALGPVQTLPAFHAQTPSAVPFIFGYLNRQDHRIADVLRSLVRSRISCGIYIRHRRPEWEQLVAGSTVRLYDEPQSLPTILPTATAVLHHGGLATAETALAAGRPQFLLPFHLEQLLTSDAVQRAGCGLNLSRHPGDVGAQIRAALADGTMAVSAAVMARQIAARPQADAKARIVAACRRHLSSPVRS
jgi:rhamnosyltransferase subunit B